MIRSASHDPGPATAAHARDDLPGLLLAAVPPVMVAVRGAVRGFASPERTLLQFRVMHELVRRPSTITELAAVSGASAAAISKVVAAMVELGLVERRLDPEDRRVTHLLLTAQGRAHGLAMLEAVRAELARRVSGLGPEERQALARGLRVLAGLFGERGDGKSTERRS